MPVIDAKRLQNIFSDTSNETKEETTTTSMVPVESENEDVEEFSCEELPTPNVIRNANAEEITEQNVNADIDYALRSQANVIVKTQQLIEIALQNAVNGGSPRDIEVATGSITALTDANVKLLELHEKIKKLKQTETDFGAGNTFVQNQVVFKGTREEALQALKDGDIDLNEDSL